MVVRHEALKRLEAYKPNGEISIPVKSGQRVKGFYVKKLVRAIRALEEMGEL